VLGEYIDSLRSRPAIIAALILAMAILLARTVVELSGNTINGYNKERPDNQLSRLGISENNEVIIEGDIDSIEFRDKMNSKEKEYSKVQGIYESKYQYMEKHIYLKNVFCHYGEARYALSKHGEKIELIYSGMEEFKIGQAICVSGKLEYYPSATNWGEFDSYKYHSCRGILCKIKLSEILSKSIECNRLANRLWLFKLSIANLIDELYETDDAAILKAMLLGIKNDLSEEIKTAFQKNGIAHILAISGLHISFLCTMIYRFLEAFRIKRCINVFLSELILALYVLMVGFSPSTIRAGVMFSLYMFASLTKRSYDMLSAMCIASIIILSFNIWLIFDSAFQLSFFAIIAIGILQKQLINNNRYLKRITKRRDSSRLFGRLLNCCLATTCSNFTASLSIYVMTLPILLYSYFEINLYSILLNMIIIPLMPVLLVSVIIGLALTVVVGKYGLLFIGIGHCILLIYKKTCIFLENTNCGRFNVGKPSLLLIMLYFAGLFVLFLYRGRKYVLVKSLGALMCLMMFVNNNHGLYMLDVGQGDGFVIVEGHDSYIFDGGSSSRSQVGEYVIIPFLKSMGVQRVRAVFLSHPDSDHVNGIYELLEKAKLECIDIGTVYVYDASLETEAFEELCNLADQCEIKLEGISKGARVSDANITVDCLYPEGGLDNNENDNSLVLRIIYDGMIVLDMGDLEWEGEEKIAIGARTDILKVAHHGSSSSSSDQFLDNNPVSMALISAGKNNSYGHPHKEVISRLDERDIPYLCTKDTGAVCIFKKKAKIYIKEYGGW